MGGKRPLLLQHGSMTNIGDREGGEHPNQLVIGNRIQPGRMGTQISTT
jgi:hypothetical protein